MYQQQWILFHEAPPTHPSSIYEHTIRITIANSAYIKSLTESNVLKLRLWEDVFLGWF